MLASATAAISPSRLLKIRAAEARNPARGPLMAVRPCPSRRAPLGPTLKRAPREALRTIIEPHVGVTARLPEESPIHQRRDHGITHGGIETPEPLNLLLCQRQTWHFGVLGPHELGPIRDGRVGDLHVDPS